MRLHPFATVGYAGVCSRSLDRGNAYFVAHWNRSNGCGSPLAYRLKQSSRLTRQFYSSAAAEPEALDVSSESLIPQLHSQLDCSYVRRLRQGLCSRQHAVGVIVNDSIGNAYLPAATVDASIWSNEPFFKRGGISDQFEYRTRLESGLHRTVGSFSRSRLGNIVR